MRYVWCTVLAKVIELLGVKMLTYWMWLYIAWNKKFNLLIVAGYYIICSGLWRLINGIKVDMFTVPFLGTTFYRKGKQAIV